MKIKNKVALITGGSQGLGEQISRVLSESGVHVIIGDIQEDKAHKLAQELSNTTSYKLDVSDSENVEDLIQRIHKSHGSLDIVVNNAGIDITKSVGELSPEEFMKVIRVNLLGPFLVTKYVLEYMKQQKSGHIINITSTAAKRSWANASAYHASKWGLRGMSHGLYVEAREYGVKVSAIVAGGMRTPFILERFPDTPLDKLQDPKHVADTIKYILEQPSDVIIPEVMVLPLMETSWP